MRRGVGLRLNAKFLVCAVASVGLWFGCGKASDPDATKVSDLKAAGGLQIYDQGNGSVKLVWAGVNQESNFSGYNVYGGKDSDGTIASTYENKTIELLDDSGNPTADGKTLLKKMSYNGTDWETAGAADANAGDVGYYAYYKSKDTDGKTPLMPSCMPDSTYGSSSTCKELTTSGGTSTFIGKTSITLTGLKYDGKYCFAVFSTLKSGKKIAQTSSEVKCVVPKYKVSLDTMTTGAATSAPQMINFTTFRSNCSGSSGCSSVPFTTGSSSCNGSTTSQVCLEKFGSDPANLYFTAGASSGVQDLGYYASGFDDPTLGRAPIISSAISSTSLKTDYGYAIPGQSLVLGQKHMYVVAETKSSTSFYYHFIYVKTVDYSSGKITAEVRVANKEDDAE